MIITFDPGVKYFAWAVLDGKTLVRYGKHEARPARVYADWFRDVGIFVTQLCSKYDAHAIIIERPQVYPGQRANPGDLMDLSITVGAIAGAAGVSDVPTLLIYPRQWKGSVPKKIHHVRLVEQLPDWWDVHTSDKDILDAIGMAWWYQGLRDRASMED